MNWFLFTQLFLAVYFTGVALMYTLRLTVLDKTPKQPKVFTGDKFSKTWWNHMLFRYFRAFIWLICVLRVFVPSIDTYLIFFPVLSQPLVALFGVLLLCAGLVLAITAHYQLGANWRSGIDPQGPTKICTNGVYQYSRNPMYIGVLMAQLGFFLALPSLFTLVCLLVGANAILRQIQAEEIHLFSTMPIAYGSYQKQVPKFF